MEATHKRSLKNGFAYDKLFPPAKGDVYTVRKNASLEDTVAFIPKVVYKHLNQTRAIAAKLKGDSVYNTCSNIWQFVYHHIQYEKDEKGFEQIRSPARTWHDRRQGVDCDCYSVFISTILLNLGIPHILRITKYRQDYFQHIYPVVPVPSGQIVIDCVANDFDYEVPYSAKKDFPMDLQFLNGFDDPDAGVGDVDDFPPGYNIGELGDLGKFKLKINFKKVLHAVNKFNPATVLLRNGLLAAMKLNMGGVANKLRWSYLTPAQAAAKGITADKLAKLTKVRNSLEKIFFGAGGQLKNLKKAMLKGKGNKDKAVIAGLGSLDFGDIDRMSVNTPLEQLLGPDIYYSENERTFQGFEGFGELGEPVTLASMGAASGVIMKLVSALKKIGSLFGGGKGGDGSNADTASSNDKSDPSGSGTDAAGGSSSGSPSPAGSAAASSGDTDSPSPPVIRSKVTAAAATSADGDTTNNSGSTVPSANQTDEDNPATPGTSTLAPTAFTTPVMSPTTTPDPNLLPAGSNPSAKESFWTKNKSWLKPVAIGAGGLTLLAIGIHLMKSKPHANAPLSGIPGNHKNHRRKNKKKKASKKKAVALL